MKNIKTFSLIALLALVFLAVPAGSAFSKDKDYDADIQAAQQAVDAAKKTMDKAKTAMDKANKEYQAIEDKYKNEKAPLDDEKARLLKQISNKYDSKIKDAQVIADNCYSTGIDCVEANNNLNNLKSQKESEIKKVNDYHQQKTEAIEAKYKEEIKQAKEKYEEAQKSYNKAQKEYDKAVDKLNGAKADKEKAENKADKKAKEADEKALKNAEKDIKNATKDIENAKEDMAKFCGTFSGKYNQNKCSKAQQKMSEAQQKMNKAQDVVDDYYDKYPNETPEETPIISEDGSEGDSEDNADTSKGDGKKQKSAEEIAKEYAEKQSAADKANNDYNKAVQDYQKTESDYYDAAFLCAHGQKEACAAMEESKEKLAELKAKADEAYAKKLKADEELNAFLQENPTADMKGKKSNYESLTSQVNNLQNQYDQAVANCKAAADKSKYYRTPDGTMMTGEEFCALADTLKDRLDQANKDLEAAKEAYDAEFAKLSDEEKGYYFMASEGELDETVYAENNDVFTSVTRRAARILAGLRPVAYLLAAFGLVGFAYAAVFNKISWKWFANISIGLFLVANMGRLIEYMVYPNAEDKQEIIAKPLDSFGDKTEKHSIKKVLSDADYEYVEPVAIYEPTPPKAEVLPNIEEVPEEDVPVDEKSGFCKSGKIMDCVNDIMNVIKNATDTINTVKQTAVGLGAAGEGIVTNVNNIMSLIKNLNPLKPKAMMTSLGQISSNIDQAMQSLKGIADRTASADQQIADTWGIEGEYGEETTKTKAGIEKAINSMGNIKNGIDNALNTLGGLVNVLF